jgi:ABC-type bacteriocin/lantibiotic exporter with double-glycine peptidase domain
MLEYSLKFNIIDHFNSIDNSKLSEIITIKDLNLKIKRGEFVWVIGDVGSGKSTLVSALLGELVWVEKDVVNELSNTVINDDVMDKVMNMSFQWKSKIKMGGTVNYVQQNPWIQNKSIRNNILFGLPFDQNKYESVLEMWELVSDLDSLYKGDLTEIGEKGVNLSGGQKARISLARAIYADTDIILMDDPLSALDSNVKKNVFQNVMLKALNNKTRILVTHCIDYLDKADKIIIMENGQIKYFGIFEKIQHSKEIQRIIDSLHKLDLNKNEIVNKEIQNTKFDSNKEQKTRLYMKKKIKKLLKYL